MRIIVFITQKGGCGKSTLAACLALAAQEAGERVYAFDMDPQKSLIRWAAKRKDNNLPVQAVSAAKLPAELSALTQRNVSLVVLDTPALESPATLAAIKAADLSVVPARPAALTFGQAR
jgi:chromosome partitioning protein